MLAWSHWLTVADEVQPSRTVFAAAMPARAGRTREALRHFILQVALLKIRSEVYMRVNE